MIKNVNTIEEYRSLDKGAILSQAARTVRHHPKPPRSNVALPDYRYTDLGRDQ